MDRVLCINAAGPGDLHGLRMRRLASYLGLRTEFLDVERTVGRGTAASAVWRAVSQGNWDLVYQESTGIAAGASLIRAARLRGQPFIVSSGDPISGYFRTTRGPLAGALAAAYERLLYRSASAFIGWTPYLTGRALELGARRAATIEGAVDTSIFHPATVGDRLGARARFSLPENHLVVGVVGSLRWSSRQRYCYGLELVETLKRASRTDVSVLIVGDGDGRERLSGAVPERLRSRVVFTGRLDESGVVGALAAMDVGFITQTLDGLGIFRLTTKLPEYLACGVPVAMSPVPGFFDYAAGAGWALPPYHPASNEFHSRCAGWLDTLGLDEVRHKATAARPTAEARFSYDVVGPRFSAFVREIVASRSLRETSANGHETRPTPKQASDHIS